MYENAIQDGASAGLVEKRFLNDFLQKLKTLMRRSKRVSDSILLHIQSKTLRPVYHQDSSCDGFSRRIRIGL